MKVLIFGAGAVGAYFGGRLAQAGADVSVVGRSDYEEIKANVIDGEAYFDGYLYFVKLDQKFNVLNKKLIKYLIKKLNKLT